MKWEFSHKQISHELFTCPSNFEFIILSTWELHRSLPHSGNRPKKFDLVHQTVLVWSGHESRVIRRLTSGYLSAAADSVNFAYEPRNLYCASFGEHCTDYIYAVDAFLRHAGAMRDRRICASADVIALSALAKARK